MKILDTQTGRIHEYGENCHDSLYVSNDGRYLTYYNLQNGDGSGVGDYRFVCDDGKVPAESQTADAVHAEVYFNIGGFSHKVEPDRPTGDLISRSALKKEIAELHQITSEENIRFEDFTEIIDNAPTVEISGLPKVHYDRGFIAGYEKGKAERPQGECASTSTSKESRDCSTCARYSEFQKEIPEECKGCKHNYFSNYKEKGGAI